MAGIHPKGRVGEDGVTRYYDPTKHAWITEKQIKDEQRANQITDFIIKIAYIVMGVGGFLFMLVVTFSG